MGKYSNYERKERDFYPTPYEAVIPLLPHLKKCTKFAEPCAGDGILIDHLTKNGHECVWASDIEPQCSSVLKKNYVDVEYKSDCIITNPPWTRSILHNMIIDMSSKCDTWLLFDADWMHTKQSSQYMVKCHKIVSVGRIKWFGNMTGKENCAWYFFNKNDSKNTIFYGR